MECIKQIGKVVKTNMLKFHFFLLNEWKIIPLIKYPASSIEYPVSNMVLFNKYLHLPIIYKSFWIHYQMRQIIMGNDNTSASQNELLGVIIFATICTFIMGFLDAFERLYIFINGFDFFQLSAFCQIHEMSYFLSKIHRLNKW